MEERTRRARYRYEVRVNGLCWAKAVRQEAAKAAAEAAVRGWARGKDVRVVEIENGAFCPFLN